MPVIEVVHRTAYRYRSAVRLHPHRLMLRPRESRDIRLLSFEVRTAPAAAMTWATDVAGNAVATARFEGTVEALVIESQARLEITAPVWPVFDLAASAARYPFAYPAEEVADLAPLTALQYADPEGELAAWAEGFVRRPETDTLSLLKDLSLGTARQIAYQSREDEGTQTPVETLRRGWGSCRDLAVLFAEAARTLGFAARIVSGYLHDPERQLLGAADSGSTHAWAEIYLGGAGWVTFDPTNGGVGAANLVPVAVGRSIGQVMPVSGSFTGHTNALCALEVEVRLTTPTPPAAMAGGDRPSIPS